MRLLVLCVLVHMLTITVIAVRRRMGVLVCVFLCTRHMLTITVIDARQCMRVVVCVLCFFEGICSLCCCEAMDACGCSACARE
jgi:hypothetical protein